MIKENEKPADVKDYSPDPIAGKKEDFARGSKDKKEKDTDKEKERKDKSDWVEDESESEKESA